MVKALTLAGVTIALFFVIHIAVFRAKKMDRRFLAIMTIFGAASLFYLAAYWSGLGESLRGWIPLEDPYTGQPSLGWNLFFCLTGYLYFGLVFLIYLEVYFTADRSITIRVMREIRKSPAKALRMEEFKSLFETEQIIFQRRFREMVLNGYLTEKNGVYRLTPVGTFVADYNDFLIRLIQLEGG